MKLVFLMSIFLISCTTLSDKDLAEPSEPTKAVLPPKAGVSADCMFKGKKLWGKVQIVKRFPDIKVKEVTRFPDLKVKKVTSFPNKCGLWKIVTRFPDFKIQIVKSFPDIKIQYVSRFPGVK